MTLKRKNGCRGLCRPIPYDYEAAFTHQIEVANEWFIDQIRKTDRKGRIYALKEIRAGEQLEIEVYPQFTSHDEIPASGRIKKDNSRAQRTLNDKNARKKVERLINANFDDRDIWITLTYSEKYLPYTMKEALANMARFIRTVNRRRKKQGLSNAKYIYVTEYDPDAEIRWHHHVVMDGALDMDVVEKCWKYGGRNETRRLKKDESGLSGLASYIVKEKHRRKNEKRWNCSKGLKQPDIKVVRSKRPGSQGGYKKISTYVSQMVRGGECVAATQMCQWYPEYDLTDIKIYWNEYNYAFYIKGRMRRKEKKPYEDHGSGRKDWSYV